MISKKIMAIALCISVLGAASCRKRFDINLNPNVAQEVTPALLLPTAQLQIGSALGVDMNNNGSIWVQHWTQSASASQYKTLEQYQPTGSTYDRVWSLFYTGALPDLRRMEQLAIESNQRQYQAIAKILTAYSYQLITDAWGDVPFTEALLGLPESGSVLSPRYDPQERIYDSIIRMTQAGLNLINVDDPAHPGGDDLIYGGDMHEWQLFANTLLLRMHMRLSERNPGKAQAGIAALFANGIGFLGVGDDAQINYSTSAGNQNPLSLQTRSLGPNQIASATSADSLNSNADPRRTKFFNTTGTVTGLRQGNPVATTGVTYTQPGPLTGAQSAIATSSLGQQASAAPVRLLTSYESIFLQAEAVARGWATGTVSADSLFRNGIRASFLHLGLTTAQANTYINSAYWGNYPSGGSLQQRLRHIITQKWISMTGIQGFEAWTEWRRTGYPDFLVISQTSLIGNIFPARFLYPDVEFSRNANFPGQKVVYDKVWWDVN